MLIARGAKESEQPDWEQDDGNEDSEDSEAEFPPKKRRQR